MLNNMNEVYEQNFGIVMSSGTLEWCFFVADPNECYQTNGTLFEDIQI